MRRQIHQLTPDEVHALLRSRPEGLPDDEVLRRLAEIGPNRLSEPPRFQALRLLTRQFRNLFALLLAVSGSLCFVADHMQPGEGMAVLGWALFAVALLNAFFSFAQEMRAERAMSALRQMLPNRVRVCREGIEVDVAAEQLVPGDLVRLGEGDRVPADARLVESHDLLVNNAPLTGESRHVSLDARPVAGGRLIDSPNLVFAGCLVLRGHGRAVIYATGRRTEFGKIATLSVEVRRPPSPIERELDRMIRILTAVAVVMGSLFFAYGVAIGRPLWVNVVFMLGIIVANVPEGLLPTFTLALAMGAVRLAKRQVLVKGLSAVEALGSVDVICTDKTGTLTRNELAVSGLLRPADGEPLDGPSRRRLLEAVVTASSLHGGGGDLTGDPLDVAAARTLRAEGGSPEDVIAATVRQIPFDVARRRAAGLRRRDGAMVFATKGAWEALRPHLATVVADVGGLTAADAPRLELIDKVVRRAAATGGRVIAVAERAVAASDLDAPEAELERGLTLLGLLCLADPLRPEVPGAVARCHTAGIDVILVTGDHPDTARAIAIAAGILTADAATGCVLTGDVLEQLRETALVERLRAGVRVFARTSPEQKLKIVAALKRMGRIVGMTGDGVNDAPALRAADVGVAMGVSGTDVAREAAQIVLLDDNFASIVAGVEEGRTVFANMKRFTTYVLASNVPEIVPFLLYVALPIPLALTVIQILTIDLGSDIVPAIGLGQEPPEPGVMEQPPRGVGERLLGRPLLVRAYLFLGLIEAAWAICLFFTVLYLGGWHYGQELATNDPLYRSATGITLAATVLTQIGNLIGRRSDRGSGLDRGLLTNPLLVIGIGIEIAFSWAVLYYEPVQQFLGTGPVPASIYLLAWLGPLLLFSLDYVRKRFANRPLAAVRNLSAGPVSQ